MTTWNNFGGIADAVLRKFALAGYVPTVDDFGGAAAVDDAMADAAEEIVQALPGTILHLLQEPDLCILVNRATDGQVDAIFPDILKPVISGSVHVWAGPPQAFVSRPVLVTTPWSTDWPRISPGRLPPNPTPPGAQVELAETDFSADANQVTLATPRLRNDQVLGSWIVDVDHADYLVPSLAGLVAMGAAAAIGAKVYPQASSQWDQVQRLSDSFAEAVSNLATGKVVPPEIRSLQWWKEPEPTQAGGMSSVRRFRA